MNKYKQYSTTSKGLNHKLQKKYWLTRQKLLGRKDSINSSKNSLLSSSSYESIPQDDMLFDYNDEIQGKITEFENIKKFLQNHIKIGNLCVKHLKKISQCEITLKESILNMTSLLQDYTSKIARKTCECLDVTSNERENVANSIEKFNEDISLFYNKAIMDAWKSMEELNKSKISLAATFCWMNKASKDIDPDVSKKVSKFKGVQDEVKIAREKYLKLSDSTCGKISLIALSSDNLIMRRINDYQQNLIQFINNSLIAYQNFSLQFKISYVPYEFKFLKNVLGDNNGIKYEEYVDGKLVTEHIDSTLVADLITLDDSDDSGNQSCKNDLTSNDNNSTSLNKKQLETLSELFNPMKIDDILSPLDSKVTKEYTLKSCEEIPTLNHTSKDKHPINCTNIDEFESKQWEKFFKSLAPHNEPLHSTKQTESSSFNFDNILRNIDPIDRISQNDANSFYC